MKKWLFFLVAALFLGSALRVLASDTKTGNIHVAPNEIVSGNLYLTGESIIVEGVVSGDLIAAAQKISITGRIDGDVIAIAQEIVIDGEVGGNARLAGNSLTINGQVSRNVNSFGSDIKFGPKSQIGWDVYLAGSNADLKGTIEGSLSGQAEKVTLSGQIGKNVNLKISSSQPGSQLTIQPTALINGDLNYSSLTPADISVEASIAGNISQSVPQNEQNKNWLAWAWKEVFALFAALIAGLAIIYLSGNTTKKILDKMLESPGQAGLAGLISFLAIPLFALFLAFSIIGLPLALIFTVIWIISLYLGKVLSALFIGRLIADKLGKVKESSLIIPLVIGVMLVWLITAIPYFGWLINLIAVLFGLGGLANYAYRQRQNI